MIRATDQDSLDSAAGCAGDARPDSNAPSGLAKALRSDRQNLLLGQSTGGPYLLAQPGGWCLSPELGLPPVGPTDPIWCSGDEPTVELFTATAEDRRRGAVWVCAATSGDESAARWWLPWVEKLVRQVAGAAASIGVRLRDPVTVTASLTPLDGVNGVPHLDDDLYEPGADVGLVAIVGSHAGPRLATGWVPILRPRPAVGVVVADEAVERFGDDPIFWSASTSTPSMGGDGEAARCVPSVVAYPARRIVVCCRFGQLHAGPLIGGHESAGQAEGSAVEHRSLLVLRCGVTPVASAEGGHVLPDHERSTTNTPE